MVTRVLVLDTSALVEFLVGADATAELIRTSTAGARLAAPHGVDLECTSVLRGLVRGGKLSEDEAARALTLLGRMRLRRYDHVSLLPRIWELRHNMWPYDASYIALAESLGAEVITLDAKLASAPGIRCRVRDLRRHA
ncbi:type II toxin-antitoxin system VapC family toxin [Streptomyces sp. LP05-1]|uniref:Ribonuclease VapC n=1 Tax=Streptomyces pyxinae TaxID=2970734 RepID=A0ABT2CH22_9ACTN|nr:type II toxin-antitoxin system VapC family toxin [Streptomyces sp. LP05-1]MCS0635914.1 type II toxin-antitoxin system VapC family toxin [Streptomyces sp. LP05-1]